MSKQVSIILIIAIAILTSQCTTNKNKMIEKINELESEVNASFPNPNPNPLKIKELHNLYIDYVNKYEKDTLSPHFIYKAAETAVNTQQYEEAINNLDLLINKYPNHKLVPYAIFFKGFIYENFLNDKENAEKQYRIIISKYKDHPLGKQAIFSIESLNMTDQEIVERMNMD